MNPGIDLYLEELRRTAILANLNYEIWWVYEGKSTRSKYLNIMSNYGGFFPVSSQAHFVATMILLYRFYEKRKDTYNIYSFLEIIKNEGLIEGEKIKKIEELCKIAKPLWVKISTIRNKMFGHRAYCDSAEILKDSKLTPNNIRDLIKETEGIINEIMSSLGKGGWVKMNGAGEDTISLLEDLSKMEGIAKRLFCPDTGL